MRSEEGSHGESPAKMPEIPCDEKCRNKPNAIFPLFQNPPRKKELCRRVYVFNTRRAKIEAKSHLWRALAHLRDETVPSSEEHEGLSHSSWMRSLYWRAAHATIPIVEKSEFPSALKYLYLG